MPLHRAGQSKTILQHTNELQWGAASCAAAVNAKYPDARCVWFYLNLDVWYLHFTEKACIDMENPGIGDTLTSKDSDAVFTEGMTAW
jgi:hypothetical protein